MLNVKTMYGRCVGNLIIFKIGCFGLNTSSRLLAASRNSLKSAISENISRNCVLISYPIEPILSTTLHNELSFR